MKIHNIALALCLITIAPTVFAYDPLVICGQNDPAGTTELDMITIHRGGHYENQLVIRNKNILSDFISKEAILPTELNGKGEFITSGFAGAGGHRSMHSRVSRTRNISFYPLNSGYRLVIYRVAPDGFSSLGELANFFFGTDCQSF